MFWKFWEPKALVTVKIGGKGRWRWTAREPMGRLIAVATVWGYSTEHNAKANAKFALRGFRIEWIDEPLAEDESA